VIGILASKLYECWHSNKEVTLIVFPYTEQGEPMKNVCKKG